MRFSEVVARRRMVRRYSPEPVAPEIVDHVVRAGLRGPSAGFSQGVEFLVLDHPDDVARYWNATTDPAREPDSWLRGMRTAPVLVLCLADPAAYVERYALPDKGWTDRSAGRWPIPYWDVDCGMGAMLVLLAAVDAGLGACFFGIPGERHGAVRAAFGIPERLRLVGVISLGHSAQGERPLGSGRSRARRPAGETLHRGRYRQTTGPGDQSHEERNGTWDASH